MLLTYAVHDFTSTSHTRTRCRLQVPYTLEALIGGAACVASTWALRSADVCMNMMPLYHVGGIVRNVVRGRERRAP